MDTETVRTLVETLGPAGAVLLIVAVGLFFLVRMGLVTIKPKEEDKPAQPSVSVVVNDDDGGKAKPECPAIGSLRVEIARLESVNDHLRVIEGRLATVEAEVATHNRILINPDAGSRSVIDRLGGVEESLTRIEELLREAIAKGLGPGRE